MLYSILNARVRIHWFIEKLPQTKCGHKSIWMAISLRLNYFRVCVCEMASVLLNEPEAELPQNSIEEIRKASRMAEQTNLVKKICQRCV